MKALITKVFFGILVIGLLSACSGTQPTDAPASSSPESAAPTDAPAPTNIVIPTDTAVPTNIVIPTDTAVPTNTVVPTVVVPPTTPPTESSGQTTLVSFSNDVLPILDSRCRNCHGGDRTEEGLNLTTFAGIMAGSENGSILTPGDADNSLLAEQVVSQEMPKRGPKLTPPQVQTLIDWINQGALDN